MVVYQKKDALDMDKVNKKFEEIKDMPPETVKILLEQLSKTKTWSELEYKDLYSRYVTRRIAVEREQDRKKENDMGTCSSCRKKYPRALLYKFPPEYLKKGHFCPMCSERIAGQYSHKDGDVA